MTPIIVTETLWHTWKGQSIFDGSGQLEMLRRIISSGISSTKSCLVWMVTVSPLAGLNTGMLNSLRFFEFDQIQKFSGFFRSKQFWSNFRRKLILIKFPKKTFSTFPFRNSILASSPVKMWNFGFYGKYELNNNQPCTNITFRGSTSRINCIMPLASAWALNDM